MKTHLAILRQPFLDLILTGVKTIESRFSFVKCAPYDKISADDKVLLKKSGGGIYGEFVVEKVEFYGEMTPEKIFQLMKYSKQICTDYEDDFWEKRKTKKYVTLIWITQLKKYEKPIMIKNSGMSGWKVLEDTLVA